MELVVAEVQGSVDGLEGLKVHVDFALFALLREDFAAVDDEAVGRDFVVEFEALLGGGDGGEDGEAVDAGFDVRGGALACALIWYRVGWFGGAYVFFCQHLLCA